MRKAKGWPTTTAARPVEPLCTCEWVRSKCAQCGGWAYVIRARRSHKLPTNFHKLPTNPTAKGEHP